MSKYARILAISVLAAAAIPATVAQQRIVDVRQGTDIAIAVSPSRDELVIDLLGQLWRLPASGGGAVPLTPAGERARQPRYSPDGRHIVYQRLLDRQWDLWLIDLGSGTRRALTDSPNDERHPDFLDDSNVVYSSNVTGEYALWALETATGRSTQLTSARGDASFPTVADDGTIAYVRQDTGRWSLRTLSRDTGNIELLTSDEPLSAPSWRPGGGVIVFHQSDRMTSSRLRMLLLSDMRVLKTLAADEDIYAVRPAWLSPAQYLYAADGQIWRRGIGEQRREPVHLFAGVAVDVEQSQQIRAKFDAVDPRPIEGTAGRAVLETAGVEVFSALGDLWLADGEVLRQLTSDAYLDIDPAWLPDGSGIVFASDRDGAMRLWLLDIDSSRLRRLTSGPSKAYSPAVNPAGDTVAFLETSGFGPWAPSRVQLLDLDRGAVIASSSETYLGTSAPRWIASPTDARLQITTAGTNRAADLRIVELDAELIPVARRNVEISEAAPSAAIGTLETRPQWQRALSTEPYVIQAGRLFDGTAGAYRRHVDIHVDGHRISAVVGRDVLPLPDRVIDAQELTVMPGFIDIHVHQASLAGERLGRIWLAHGVTTVREISDNLPESVSRSESWAARKQLGPRLLVSPTSSLLMNVDAAGESDFLAPTLNRRLLNGPVHAPVLESAAETDSLHSIAVVPLMEPANGFDLRSSPLQAQYQDVFSTIMEAGFVTGTAIGAMQVFDLSRTTSASSPLSDRVQRLYSLDEQLAWLRAGTGPVAIQPRQTRIARLIRSGARVAIGTDAPVVPYGLGLHAELALLADAGIPNDQVLRIATMEGALALGLDREVGSIEQGKLADLLIIDGDPLADVSEAANIEAVVLGGLWIDADALLESP